MKNHPIHAKKILVIDDDPTILDLLSDTFKEIGVSIEMANTVASALAQINERDFDIIFLDIKLPDGSGLDILKISIEYHLKYL